MTRRGLCLGLLALLLLPSSGFADGSTSLPKWMALLQKGTSTEKKLALDNLWELHYAQYTQDPHVWDPVLAAVADHDATVREAAVAFLRGIGEDHQDFHSTLPGDCCKELVNALNDPSPRVRAQAAAALIQLPGVKPEQKLDLLIDRLKDPDPWVRLNAVHAVSALGALRASKAIDALTALFHDDSDWRNHYVQQEAVAALGMILFATGPGIGDHLSYVVNEHGKYLGHPDGARIIIPGAGGRPLPPDLAKTLQPPTPAQSAAFKTLIEKRNDPYLRRALMKIFAAHATPEAKGAIQDALNDPDEVTRRFAAQALARLPIDQHTQLTVALKSVDDPSPLVRAESARALGEVQDGAAIDPLIRLLGDRDYTVQKAAIDALANYKDDEKALTALADRLITTKNGKMTRNSYDAQYVAGQFQNRVINGSPVARTLTDDSGPVRLTITIRKNPTAVTALLKSYADADDKTRMNVLPLLASFDDERVTSLFHTLLNGANPAVWVLAAQTLKYRSITDFSPLLFARLKDKDPAVRKAAVNSLMVVDDDPRVKSSLAGMSHDEDPRVREAVVWALGRFKDHDPIVKSALVGMLHDENPRVRQVAVQMLGRFRDNDLVTPLLASLNDADGNIRRMALMWLGALTDPRIPDANLRMLHDPYAGQQAVYNISRAHDRNAVEPLIALFNDDRVTNGELYRDVTSALVEIGDPRAVEPLMEALDGRYDKGRDLPGKPSRDALLRKYAAQALGRFKDNRALPHLAKALLDEHEDQSVRFYAAQAIGEIGDPSALDVLNQALNQAMKSGTIGGNNMYLAAINRAIAALSKK